MPFIIIIIIIIILLLLNIILVLLLYMKCIVMCRLWQALLPFPSTASNDFDHFLSDLMHYFYGNKISLNLNAYCHFQLIVRLCCSII